MAVRANFVYEGQTFSGTTFTVTSAYIKSWARHGDQSAQNILVYEVEVKLANNKVVDLGGWSNVKKPGGPNLSSGHGTPLVQAEAAMKTRLAAEGSQNIADI